MKHLNRINKLVSLLPKNINKLIDVGCDHGYFGCVSLKQKATNAVVFCDISDKCLSKAINNVEKYGYGKLSKFLVCDGIPKINADLVAINGLGGMAIIDILKRNTIKYRYYLLQPMSNIFEVRKFLKESNYKVLIDTNIKVGGRFYTVILLDSVCGVDYTEDELVLGKEVLNFPQNHKEFLQYRLKITDNALANCGINMLKSNVDDSVLNLFKENQLINRLLKEIE